MEQQAQEFDDFIHQFFFGKNVTLDIEEFLFSYRLYCSPQQLIDKIIQKMPESKKSSKIENIVSEWVLHHPSDFKQINTKSVLELGEISSQELKNKLKLFLLKQKTPETNSKHKSTLFSGPASPAPLTSMPLPSLLSTSPQEIAESLTRLEAQMFKDIALAEYIGWTYSKNDEQKERNCPNIFRLVRHFNRVSYWVGTEILTKPTFDEQLKSISFFIKVAKHAEEIGNFNTLMELLSGLNSSAVQRLSKLWEALSFSKKASFDSLDELMRPQQNFKNYRSKLKKRKGPVLPYNGIFTRDVTFIHECNSKFIPKTREGLGGESRNVEGINDTLWVQLGALAKDIYQFQNRPYTLPASPVIDHFITHAPVISDEDELYTLSTKIQPSLYDLGDSNSNFKSPNNTTANNTTASSDENTPVTTPHAPHVNLTISSDDEKKLLGETFSSFSSTSTDSHEIPSMSSMDLLPVVREDDEAVQFHHVNKQWASTGSLPNPPVSGTNSQEPTSLTPDATHEDLSASAFPNSSSSFPPTKLDANRNVSLTNYDSKVTPTSSSRKPRANSIGAVIPDPRASLSPQFLDPPRKSHGNNPKKSGSKRKGPITISVPTTFHGIFGRAETQVLKYFEKCEHFAPRGIIQTDNNSRFLLLRSSSLSRDLYRAVADRLYKNNIDMDNAFDHVNQIDQCLFDTFYVAGMSEAKFSLSNLTFEKKVDILAAGLISCSFIGMGHFTIDQKAKPVPGTDFNIEFSTWNSPEAASWLETYPTEGHVMYCTDPTSPKTTKFQHKMQSKHGGRCVNICGYLSGYFSHVVGMGLTCVEWGCRALGFEKCSFVIAHPNKVQHFVRDKLVARGYWSPDTTTTTTTTPTTTTSSGSISPSTSSVTLSSLASSQPSNSTSVTGTASTGSSGTGGSGKKRQQLHINFWGVGDPQSHSFLQDQKSEFLANFKRPPVTSPDVTTPTTSGSGSSGNGSFAEKKEKVSMRTKLKEMILSPNKLKATSSAPPTPLPSSPAPHHSHHHHHTTTTATTSASPTTSPGAEGGASSTVSSPGGSKDVTMTSPTQKRHKKMSEAMVPVGVMCNPRQGSVLIGKEQYFMLRAKSMGECMRNYLQSMLKAEDSSLQRHFSDSIMFEFFEYVGKAECMHWIYDLKPSSSPVKDRSELIKWLPIMMAQTGWGKLVIQSSTMSLDASSFYLDMYLHGSFEIHPEDPATSDAVGGVSGVPGGARTPIQHHHSILHLPINGLKSKDKKEKNPNEHSPKCLLHASFLAGWLSQFAELTSPVTSGLNLSVAEVQCEGLGHASCRFVAAPANKISSIAKELTDSPKLTKRVLERIQHFQSAHVE